MGKRTKIWLIIAASLVLIGLMIFAAVMAVYRWDFTEREEFSNISMKTQTADIQFAASDDGICRVVCYETENEKHSVSVENGTLTVSSVDEREWYEFGISAGTPKITVYLPESEYAALIIKESTGDVEIPKDFMFESIDISLSTGDVKSFASASELIKILTSTGDICVENVSADMLDLSVSTGDVTVSSVTCEGDVAVGVSTGKAYLSDIVCKSVISSGGTGDISLKNVLAAEKLSVERSTGDVMLAGCDAAEIFISTDTGDIAGSLLTDKVFIVETDTGSVNVPKSAKGGKCEIISNTGDIDISIS